MADKKKLIFVLGMHRSGTSPATRLLNILGADLSLNLLQPDPDINEKGYFEDKDVVTLNESVLSHFNAAWYDIKSLPETWWQKDEVAPFKLNIKTILERNYNDFHLAVIKDPRLCILFPLWLDVIEDLYSPLCIFVLRHPVEVAKSLEKRDGIDRGYSYYLWMRYVLASEYHTRRLRRTAVTFDQILSDAYGISKKISNALDIKWPKSFNDNRHNVTQDISTDLKHHSSEREALKTDSVLIEMAVDIFQKMTASDPDDHQNYFDTIRLKLDTPDDPIAKALKDALQKTNARRIKNTAKMMEIGDMHSHALTVLAEQEQVIIKLQTFKKKIFSHWAWPIMRRLPNRGVNLND